MQSAGIFCLLPASVPETYLWRMEAYIPIVAAGFAIVSLLLHVTSLRETSRWRRALSARLMSLTSELRDAVVEASRSSSVRAENQALSTDEARLIVVSASAIAKRPLSVINEIRRLQRETASLHGRDAAVKVQEIISCWNAKELMWRSAHLANGMHPSKVEFDSLLDRFFLGVDESERLGQHMDQLRSELTAILYPTKRPRLRLWGK